MADQRLLIQTLSEFAETLVKGFAISDVLHSLAERVSAVLRVDGAGVSLQHAGQLRFVTALDERSTALERAQENSQAGPCVEAWRSGKAVTVTDLRRASHGWVAYEKVARLAGVVAVAGVPLRLNSHHIGSLNLYSSTAREWQGDDLAAARVLADVATSYVINASRLEREQRVSEQLREALDSRIVIEQAKGILAAEHGITVDRAFELMRQRARSRNATLRAVAQAVVDLGLRF